MSNVGPRWIKEIIIAVVAGYASGKIVSILLGLVLTAAKWELFISMFIPGFIVIGLVIVLARYNKEKSHMLGESE